MTDNDVMATITIRLQRDGVLRSDYSRNNEVAEAVTTLLYMGMLTSCCQHLQKWRDTIIEEQEKQA